MAVEARRQAGGGSNARGEAEALVESARQEVGMQSRERRWGRAAMWRWVREARGAGKVLQLTSCAAVHTRPQQPTRSQLQGCQGGLAQWPPVAIAHTTKPLSLTAAHEQASA